MPPTGAPNGRVLDVQLRLCDDGFLLRHLRIRGAGVRFNRRDLCRHCRCRRQAGRGLRELALGLRLAALHDVDVLLCQHDCRLRRLQRRLRLLLGRDHEVVLLVRHFVLRDERLEARLVLRRARQVRFRLALSRLRRRQARLRRLDVARRQVDTGLRVLPLRLRAGQLRARHRRVDGDARARRLRRRARFGQVGFRPGERHLQVARIDLDEHVALLHFLVVSHQDPLDRAADLRGDRRDVPVDLRVVGRLPTRQMNPRRDDDRDDDETSGHQPPRAAAQAPRRCGQ